MISRRHIHLRLKRWPVESGKGNIEMVPKGLLAKQVNRIRSFSKILSPLPTNGIGGSPPENLLSPLDGSSQTNRLETAENDKHGKIPVNAVRPHTNSPGLVKHSSTSSLLKVAVLQQHSVGLEETQSLQPRSPRCSSYSPRGTRAELVARQHTTYAPKGSAPSPSQRLPGVDTAHSPSYQSPVHPSTPPAIAKRLESPKRDFVVSSPHRSVEHLVPTDYHLQQSPKLTQQHTPHGPRSGQPITDPQTPRSSYSPESSKMDSDDAASGSESRKKKKSRSRGDQEGNSADGNSKQTRVKKGSQIEI
ncbi:unnamed protein product [Staurois parvus]|uniref:Mediator complex subunit 26 middle domain-containing protein n=1 Tax=Staurois parvus TaxID=386267 RepID=A0ABN9DL61_9NEOB|nr:unnamed protein product [Staurois parvus]